MSDDDSSKIEKMKRIMKKFLDFNSKPTMETFPELIDCTIWLRFVLAVFFGTWIGHESKNRGGANILFGLNFITFLPILWAKTFLGADQDSYGSKLLFSGVVQGLALSMLIWIYFYTESHRSDETIFITAFSSYNGEEVSPETEDDPQITQEEETEF